MFPTSCCAMRAVSCAYAASRQRTPAVLPCVRPVLEELVLQHTPCVLAFHLSLWGSGTTRVYGRAGPRTERYLMCCAAGTIFGHHSGVTPWRGRVTAIPPHPSSWYFPASRTITLQILRTKRAKPCAGAQYTLRSRLEPHVSFVPELIVQASTLAFRSPHRILEPDEKKSKTPPAWGYISKQLCFWPRAKKEINVAASGA